MRKLGLTNSWAKGNQAIDCRLGEAQAGLVGQSSVPDLVGDVGNDDLRTENGTRLDGEQRLVGLCLSPNAAR